ncbi:hypothetical protein HOY34_21565 [Xinfangfangia sp. D13-10-4-6]|uniref:hypothetical protein n=1 Tax=Pseudogemmobacter hezensis TaxID=2737662 RepID=UPI001551A6CD|nr:hypothetical protein [Pseudogemmobacter hezensis]NPD17766.1 hypothetical protein [Pseudogemmobacter hezensis]
MIEDMESVRQAKEERARQGDETVKGDQGGSIFWIGIAAIATLAATIWLFLW